MTKAGEGSPSGGATPRQLGLTAEAVIEAAVTMADDDGLEALTMRKLADRCGVKTMSLYHYVANKDEVLNGMVDAVFAEIEMTDDGGWRSAMERQCRSLRAALARHPWAIPLMDSRPDPGVNQFDHHEGLLGCLRRAGFSVGAAGRAFALLDSFVYGFALQEANLPFDSTETLEALAIDLVEQIPADRYPYLRELVTEQVLAGGYQFSDQFDAGLELVLDGLATLLAADSVGDDRNGDG